MTATPRLPKNIRRGSNFVKQDDSHNRSFSLPEDRPWLPTQIMGATVLLGTLAGSILLAINLHRLGQSVKARQCTIIGLALTVLLALAYGCFPIPVQLGLFVGAVVGMVFKTIQQKDFDSWKERNWDSITTAPYKPTQLGRLVAIGLVCLLIQVTLTVLLSLALN
jgi:hypothetical protein